MVQPGRGEGENSGRGHQLGDHQAHQIQVHIIRDLEPILYISYLNFSKLPFFVHTVGFPASHDIFCSTHLSSEQEISALKVVFFFNSGNHTGRVRQLLRETQHSLSRTVSRAEEKVTQNPLKPATPQQMPRATTLGASASYKATALAFATTRIWASSAVWRSIPVMEVVKAWAVVVGT